MLSSITDSFWIEKSTNHLCNNSFHELVSSHRRQTMVSWVGITVDDSLMQVERLPCRLSTPSQAHLQGPQRLWKEAYHQRFCCLITFSLSLLFIPLASTAAIRICTLSPHHHLFIYPHFSAVFLTALWFFSICDKNDPDATKGKVLETQIEAENSEGKYVVTPHHSPLMPLLLLPPLTGKLADHQPVFGSWICWPIQSASRAFMQM